MATSSLQRLLVIASVTSYFFHDFVCVKLSYKWHECRHFREKNQVKVGYIISCWSHLHQWKFPSAVFGYNIQKICEDNFNSYCNTLKDMLLLSDSCSNCLIVELQQRFSVSLTGALARKSAGFFFFCIVCFDFTYFLVDVRNWLLLKADMLGIIICKNIHQLVEWHQGKLDLRDKICSTCLGTMAAREIVFCIYERV